VVNTLKVNTIKTTDKQVMKVYAARDYDLKHPRLTNYVDINIPEYTPTIPRDDKFEMIGISSNYCANSNFPINDTSVEVTHYITLPLLRGTQCPVYFNKDTPFLLFTPTGRLEEGYLLYM